MDLADVIWSIVVLGGLAAGLLAPTLIAAAIAASIFALIVAILIVLVHVSFFPYEGTVSQMVEATVASPADNIIWWFWRTVSKALVGTVAAAIGFYLRWLFSGRKSKTSE